MAAAGMRLAGKVAVVTGGAQGIGAAVVRKFLQEGARVVVADIDEDRGRRLVEEILLTGGTGRDREGGEGGMAGGMEKRAEERRGGEGLGEMLREGEGGQQQVGGGGRISGVGAGGEEASPSCMFVSCDVRSRDSIASALTSAESSMGGIDILVNNAAVQFVPDLLHTSPSDWDNVIAAGLSSVFHASQLVVPAMRRRGGGAIVNLSSSFAVVGSPGYTAYHAAKGGVSSFTRAAAVSLLPLNIRVNAVCPGTTLTPGLQQSVVDSCSSKAEQDSLMQVFMSKQPMGRFGTPEEIANVITFLASDEASFVVGANVVADGAYTIV